MKAFKTEFKNSPGLFAFLSPNFVMKFDFTNLKLQFYSKFVLAHSQNLKSARLQKPTNSPWVTKRLQISPLAAQSVVTSRQIVFQVGPQLYVLDSAFHLQIFAIPFFFNFQTQNFLFAFGETIYVSNNCNLYQLEGGKLKKQNYITIQHRFFMSMNRVYCLEPGRFCELYDDFSKRVLLLFGDIKVIGLFAGVLVYVGSESKSFAFDVQTEVNAEINFDLKKIGNNFDFGQLGFKLKKKFLQKLVIEKLVYGKAEIDLGESKAEVVKDDNEVKEYWYERRMWAQNLELMMELDLESNENEVMIDQHEEITLTFEESSDDL